MQIQHLTETDLTVTLSRKNLEQLLAALDLFEESDAFYALLPFLMRTCENGVRLTVLAQSDAEHYERREAGPGFDGIV